MAVKENVKDNLKVGEDFTEVTFEIHVQCPSHRLENIGQPREQVKQAENFLESKQNKFVCTICIKRFPFSTQYKDHMLSVHSVDTPFECTVCRRRYKTKRTLDSHERKMHELFLRNFAKLIAKY